MPFEENGFACIAVIAEVLRQIAVSRCDPLYFHDTSTTGKSISVSAT
jgi:hypothetical protein